MSRTVSRTPEFPCVLELGGWKERQEKNLKAELSGWKERHEEKHRAAELKVQELSETVANLKAELSCWKVLGWDIVDRLNNAITEGAEAAIRPQKNTIWISWARELNAVEGRVGRFTDSGRGKRRHAFGDHMIEPASHQHEDLCRQVLLSQDSSVSASTNITDGVANSLETDETSNVLKKTELNVFGYFGLSLSFYFHKPSLAYIDLFCLTRFYMGSVLACSVLAPGCSKLLVYLWA
ncbi:hypothetical protein K435DRAFT_865934 [Dendrothele bispora CBS 962.96]|uniref:Uncharacterized protein n=1 Tax=Dendrothele bispora (strain CBS 962.96) TaxID=1314807 RepID=A0A4S8LIB6_DENBC|nr:hypothetical protein K435DRAFT_865934 [Dendrothele bispora CBS 962.96]